jgi:hypothetical protein
LILLIENTKERIVLDQLTTIEKRMQVCLKLGLLTVEEVKQLRAIARN